MPPKAVAMSAALPPSTSDSLVFAENASNIFGTVDLNTGAFTEIANNSSQNLAGFGVINAILYAVNYNVANGTLYRVNTTTGALTAIGSSTITYYLFGSTSTGGLYATDPALNLYSIDEATGAAALIGPLGIGGGGGWYSLSTGASSLYFANGANLYTIDTGSGAATLVGDLGGPLMGGMAYENGVLWGGVNSPSLEVATINTTSGAATTGPAVTGTGASFWYAMAPDPIPLIQTATKLTASKTTAPDETTITLTALVTPNNYGTTTPTGSVEFFNGPSELGKVTANGTGQAVFKAKTLPLGTNSLTAHYLGDATHAVSTSAVTTVTITADTTQTALVASPTSGPPGTQITLTATVTRKSGTIPPTGTVTFKKGATVLGTASVGANGEAILMISTLKAGSNLITAVYAGDSTDKTSKSSAVTVTIT